MTALIADRKTDTLSPVDGVDPVLLSLPVAASTSIYGGAFVGVNSSGYAVPGAATNSLKIVGRAEAQALNQTQASGGSPGATGSAGSINVLVRRGVFYGNVNADTTITIASFGSSVYLSDDNTFSTSDAGGTRPYAGWIFDPAGDMAPSPLSNQVGVFVGMPNPYTSSTAASTQNRARNVVTSLAAYSGTTTNVLTASANGAWATQDGVTNVVGDVVFVQGGTVHLTAAADSGPWQITSLGGASAKWVLTRPDWFTTGAVLPVAYTLDIGGEGAMWGGTSWRSFAAVGSAVVGTNDPAFYVGRITQKITLASSASTFIAASAQSTNVGIYNGSTVGIEITYTGTGATASTTVGYMVTATPTAGYIGTSVATINAVAAGMTKNGSADASVLLVTVINW